ncbi:MAG: acyl carrier protein [Firmicutes bacterium]|nr:acyl carrier protein [Bacillota bacterium]
MTTFEKVQNMLSEQLQVEKNKIKLESDILRDLNADSISLFYMVMSIEEEYKVSISDEKITQLKTVKDVVDFVDSISK